MTVITNDTGAIRRPYAGLGVQADGYIYDDVNRHGFGGGLPFSTSNPPSGPC